MILGIKSRVAAIMLVAACARAAGGSMPVQSESLTVPSMLRALAGSDRYDSARLLDVLRVLRLDWPAESHHRCYEPITRIQSSPNQNWFVLFVAGYGPRDVGGTGRYCFLDSLGDIKWLGTNLIAAAPCISDAGQVALFSWETNEVEPEAPRCLRIEVLAKDGKSTWDSSFASLQQSEHSRVGQIAFSPDGETLYVAAMISDSSSVWGCDGRFFCIDFRTGVRWQTSLGAMFPSRIHLSKHDRQILLHDLGGGAAYRPNRILVLGDGGKIIAEHFEPHARSGPYHLDPISNALYFIDEMSDLCRVEMCTGKREERLPFPQLEWTSQGDSARIERLRLLASRPPYQEREVEPPVWSVEIRGGNVRMLRNEFLDPMTLQHFVWERVPIRLHGWRPRGRVAWLEVSDDGTPRRDVLLPEMAGMFDAREAHILRCGSRPGEAAQLDGNVLPDVECTGARSFAVTSRGILWSSEQRMVLSPLGEEPRLVEDEEPLTNLVEAGGWIAGIEPLGRITVLDPAGNRVLRHVAGYSPHFFPSGRVMHIVREQGSIAIATDGSRTSALEGVPDGSRCYSTDGRRMLVFESKHPTAHLFDVSDPFAPTLIGSLEAARNEGWHLGGGALSNDGRRVVVTIIKNLPRGQFRSHVVCDERMNVVTIPLADTVLRSARFLGDDHVLIGESWGTESAYDDWWDYARELRIYKLPKQ